MNEARSDNLYLVVHGALAKGATTRSLAGNQALKIFILSDDCSPTKGFSKLYFSKIYFSFVKNIKFPAVIPVFITAGVATVIISALAIFWLLAYFTHPVADDYCYANLYHSGNYWDAIRGEYLGWKGRYFALMFTAWFHQNHDMIEVYPKFIVATQMALLIAITFYTYSMQSQPRSSTRCSSRRSSAPSLTGMVASPNSTCFKKRKENFSNA